MEQQSNKKLPHQANHGLPAALKFPQFSPTVQCDRAGWTLSGRGVKPAPVVDTAAVRTGAGDDALLCVRPGEISAAANSRPGTPKTAGNSP